MYLYLVSAAPYLSQFIVKLGLTIEPHGRLSTYLTGCPPQMTPSHDLEFIGIWETNATTSEELSRCEDRLHNKFLRFRLQRSKPGDSEWFKFPKDPLELVANYLKSQPWIKRQLTLEEIPRPPAKKSSALSRQYYKNTNYITNGSERLALLSTIQTPVIAAITTFLNDSVQKAGYVIAPCGSGKTIMTVKGIKSAGTIRKIIICCPSNQIQTQWFNTILGENLFAQTEVHLIGSTGTTDVEEIQTILGKSKYCLITTYQSSHILKDIINETLHPELLVLDEVHHMAGVVGEAEGRTRQLLAKAADLQIKRLSLTYTPRFIVGADTTYLSMDQAEIFGSKIAELKIRALIKAGILPDFRLWTLRSETDAKAKGILEAWNATEVVRDPKNFDARIEKHILNHLIVFAENNTVAKQLEEYFAANTSASPPLGGQALHASARSGTTVLRVEGGDNTAAVLEQFTSAPRAILVNCLVLNEGVDVPIADSIAITYKKEAQGQITQMVLRAGRWHPNKSLFHILIPVSDGIDELAGLESVLMALVSCDDQIRDEIICRSRVAAETDGDDSDEGNTIVEPDEQCIMIDHYEATEADVKRCFENVRKKIFPSYNSRDIRALCLEKGIDTSKEYFALRSLIPELPEDPKPKETTWYDYLHDQKDRITVQEFVAKIPEHIVRIDQYMAWLQLPSTLPTDQHINDGYFGPNNITFNIILDKYAKRNAGGRGRG